MSRRAEFAKAAKDKESHAAQHSQDEKVNTHIK